MLQVFFMNLLRKRKELAEKQRMFILFCSISWVKMDSQHWPT